MKTPDDTKNGLEYCSLTNVSKFGKRGISYACVEDLAADALAYIKQLEAKVPKWISVEEKLPSVTGKYIVCTAKGSVYCAKFSTHKVGGDFHTEMNTHITHWMPLPEPAEV